MAEIIFVIIGITAGTGLLVGTALTTYCCCKKYRRNQLTSNIGSSKPQHEEDEDYLHSVIINQHIARHLRPNSAISFISHNYHNDMTLIASPRRLAMLEQQQQPSLLPEPKTLVIENPLISLSSYPLEQKPTTLQTYVYENPSLELGELTTMSAI